MDSNSVGTGAVLVLAMDLIILRQSFATFADRSPRSRKAAGITVSSQHPQVYVVRWSNTERNAMLARLMRTDIAGWFVQFMRGPRGKKVDKFLVKAFGFSLLMHVFAASHGFRPIPVLLLYTRGRKSGRERSSVMPYLTMDGCVYLIGSNGAKPHDPLWVENLRVDPEARIVINRVERVVRARFLSFDSAERDHVWRYAQMRGSNYEIYQRQTERRIPVIALETGAGTDSVTHR